MFIKPGIHERLLLNNYILEQKEIRIKITAN